MKKRLIPLKKVNIKYLIYFGLVILCGIFYLLSETLNKIDEKAKKEVFSLKRDIGDLKNFEVYIKKLDTFIKEKQIKKISKSQAKNILISTTDFLVKNLDAQVLQGISQEEDYYYTTLKIENKITPKIKNFLDKAFNSLSPIYSFENFQINNNQITMVFKIIQPFSED